MNDQPACPGHIGRGIGADCSMCGGLVPPALRRTADSPSEIRADCAGCRRGTLHTH
jgi:hypothetical protein